MEDKTNQTNIVIEYKRAEEKMENPNCPCPNKECPVNGDCKTCRALHKKRKTYCQSGAAQKAFINFASNINFMKNLYNTMVDKQLKKITDNSAE